MNFNVLVQKAFMLEAAGFKPIPPKARYQDGDIVVIRDDGRFAKQHNKATQAYAEQVGKTIGYQKGDQSVKYAVQFDDGSVQLIHSHFLIGPFKSRQIADTYVNNKKEMDPADLDMRGKVVYDVDQRNEKIEAKLRDVLTLPPFNVEWVDEKKAGGVTVLCNKEGVAVVERFNDPKTRKLKKYIIQVNEISGDHMDLYMIPNTPTEFLSNLNRYKTVAENLDAIRSNALSLDEMVELTFDCTVDEQGNKVVRPIDPYRYGTVQNTADVFAKRRDFFKDWIVDGSFYLDTDKSDLTDSPKSVTEQFFCYCSNVKSLRGMPLDSIRYSIVGFTSDQIQDYISQEKYKQQVRSHATSSGDTSIDELFDNILDDL